MSREDRILANDSQIAIVRVEVEATLALVHRTECHPELVISHLAIRPRIISWSLYTEGSRSLIVDDGGLLNDGEALYFFFFIAIRKMKVWISWWVWQIVKLDDQDIILATDIVCYKRKY